jgi:hypothetical protein
LVLRVGAIGDGLIEAMDGFYLRERAVGRSTTRCAGQQCLAHLNVPDCQGLNAKTRQRLGAPGGCIDYDDAVLTRLGSEKQFTMCYRQLQAARAADCTRNQKVLSMLTL